MKPKMEELTVEIELGQHVLNHLSDYFETEE